MSKILEPYESTKFKNFEIRKPTFISDPPSDDYYRYHYDLVLWTEDNDNRPYCFSIAQLVYDKKEGGFEFESVGLRYLQYREDGLEEFVISWCKHQETIIKLMEEN